MTPIERILAVLYAFLVGLLVGGIIFHLRLLTTQTRQLIRVSKILIELLRNDLLEVEQ